MSVSVSSYKIICIKNNDLYFQGIPRTGLFSRNHVASLAQRNRALQAENVNVSNTLNVEEIKDSGAGVIESSPSKSL